MSVSDQSQLPQSVASVQKQLPEPSPLDNDSDSDCGPTEPYKPIENRFAHLRAPVDAAALENGGVAPTHNRTMKEQKAWFLQKAEEHRKATAAQRRAQLEKEAREREKAAKTAAVEEDAPVSAATGTAATVVVTAPAPAPAPAPAAVIDVTDDAPTQPADGLTDKLRELKLAGGDLQSLGALATKDRTELTLALKSLGFKGLKTRNEMEKDLLAFAAA